MSRESHPRKTGRRENHLNRSSRNISDKKTGLSKSKTIWISSKIPPDLEGTAASPSRQT
jgi:hypothetical protein